MKRNKLVIFITLVLVMIFSFTALAQDDTVEITVASDTVGESYELAKEAAEMYEEENPDVEVNILDTPRLADDRLNLYLQYFEQESSEVDVYQIDVIWPGDLEEHFVDLYDYGAEEYVDDHFESIVKNNTVDDKLVAMPFQMGAGLLYYRTDLLDKYDLDVPETWEELDQAARVIQEGEREEGKDDFWGFVWQGDNYEGLTCNALEWFYSNNGGRFISRDQKITVNNDQALEMLELASNWPGEISPNGVVSFAEEDARNVWGSGNAAFMRNWPYAYSSSVSDDSPIKDDVGITPLPKGSEDGKQAATAGGWQMGVSKYSENPEIAADVVFFLTSYQVQKLRAVEGAFNPTIKDLYEDEDVLDAVPIFEDLYDVYITAIPRPSTETAPDYTEVSDTVSDYVHSVLNGDEDPEAALRYMEVDLQDITGFESGEPEEY
ncbi:MAG: ABC transporter substrate-binding protein [Halanaerobium sp.]